MKRYSSPLTSVLPLAAGIGLITWLAQRRRRHALEDRVVLITGGSRGLGLCLAREFGRRGASLVLVARDPQELERAAQELRMRGAPVHTIAADIRDEATAKRAIAETVAAMGRLDVLVNNAGIISVAPLADTTESDFHAAMETHFWAPLRFMRAAQPYLQKARGRVVNISSIGGLVAVPHLAAYSASKFALGGLSDAFRAEWAPAGIKVTSVFPGLLRTGSHLQARFRGEQSREFDWFAISSATPFSSMNADRAARKIVNACEEGAPRLILTTQAKLLHLGTALFPSLSACVAAFVSKLLPAARGETATVKGDALRASFPVGWLLALLDRAASKNNERRAV